MRWLLAFAVLLAGCTSLPPIPPGPAGVYTQECIGSGNWTDPCTSRATIENGPANENWLAVNPTDPLNVVTGAKDYNDLASSCVWGGVTVSKDGGRMWVNHYMGGTRDERADPTHPLFGYQCMTDPMFAFDAEGVLYYVVEVYGRTPHEREGLLPLPPGTLGPFDRTLQHPDTGASTIFVAVSRDGGLTFEAPVRLWDGEGTFLSLLDKTFILANPATGTIHFTTSQFLATGQATQVLTFRSTDGGATWSRPVVASALDDPDLKFPAAFSAARDGTLHLSWHDWAENRIYFTSSADDGVTWGAPRAIFDAHPLFEAPPNGQYRVVTQPYHAVDTSGGLRDGTIYLTWMEEVQSHMDILWSKSTDAGATWSSPQPLTDDDGTNAQFHPLPWVDGNGTLHITYYDRRYDPADKLLDLTWAWSTDGGATFTHRRITASGFDGDLGIHQDGFPFIGDYNGLGCSGRVCYASWADTRMGRGDIAVAKLVQR